MKLVNIIPENFKMDGGACFGVVPKSIWSKHVPSDENNMVKISSRCLLIDTGDRRILVDTGIGNKQSEKYFGYFYPFDRIGLEKALEVEGYHAAEITDVILTHLHFDHVGGAVKWAADGITPEVVFPNATYYLSRAQWDTANEPNPREKASFFPENYMPLFEQGRLEFIYEDTNFCKGVDLEIKYGHTLGQIIPLVEYKGRIIVFAADFIASVFNIPMAYVPCFDIDPATTMKEKQDFYNRAVRDRYVLLFEHDYYNECCTLEETPKGVKAGEIFKLADL